MVSKSYHFQNWKFYFSLPEQINDRAWFDDMCGFYTKSGTDISPALATPRPLIWNIDKKISEIVMLTCVWKFQKYGFADSGAIFDSAAISVQTNLWICPMLHDLDKMGCIIYDLSGVLLNALLSKALPTKGEEINFVITPYLISTMAGALNWAKNKWPTWQKYEVNEPLQIIIIGILLSRLKVFWSKSLLI